MILSELVMHSVRIPNNYNWSNFHINRDSMLFHIWTREETYFNVFDVNITKKNKL